MGGGGGGGGGGGVGNSPSFKGHKLVIKCLILTSREWIEIYEPYGS